jgi:hypothetical protein
LNRLSVSRILAALLLAGLVENWQLVAWLTGVRDWLSFLVGLTWLGLLIGSVIGLVRVRRWGIYLVFVLAPFSTIMLSTPLLPGMRLFGLRGPVALSAWNLLAVAIGIVVLRTQHVPDRKLAA